MKKVLLELLISLLIAVTVTGGVFGTVAMVYLSGFWPGCLKLIVTVLIVFSTLVTLRKILEKSGYVVVLLPKEKSEALKNTEAGGEEDGTIQEEGQG